MHIDNKWRIQDSEAEGGKIKNRLGEGSKFYAKNALGGQNFHLVITRIQSPPAIRLNQPRRTNFNAPQQSKSITTAQKMEVQTFLNKVYSFKFQVLT